MKPRFYYRYWLDPEITGQLYMDGPGTVETIYTRRVGKQFFVRVYFDGSGDDVYTDISDKPMTKLEVMSLTQSRPWLDSGFEDEARDSRVSSIWDKRN